MQVPKLRGELLVAVHDEESLAAQKAVEWVGEIPTDLQTGPGRRSFARGRRYQPTEARPSTPLSVPPINGLSRRCASTPNSNFTPSPPNAARL